MVFSFAIPDACLSAVFRLLAPIRQVHLRLQDVLSLICYFIIITDSVSDYP